jgi:sialate O-acetylesterase
MTVYALLPSILLNSVKLPAWFGDGMVLQTNHEYGARSFLSGTASPHERVTITGGAGNYQTEASASGEWKVTLNPQSVGPKGTVRVTGETGGAVTASDVVAGDVFFCSGQSNMVFPLKFAFNSTSEADSLRSFPGFRFWVTGRDYQDEPQSDFLPTPKACDAAGGACNQWVNTTTALANGSEYLLSFSAVCFLTVRDIARLHIGDRPVALIQSAWGGTRVEAWMSKEAIASAGPPVTGAVPSRKEQNGASVLYNAMVAPWDPFSVRAALWYQGEANADQLIVANESIAYYSVAYQAMLADWRERKGMGDFAVLTMQLPPSVPTGTDPARRTGRQEIRIAQAQAGTHAGGRTDISGTAVGVDLGGSSSWGIDHPPNKNEMSRRLALQGLHVACAPLALEQPASRDRTRQPGRLDGCVSSGTAIAVIAVPPLADPPCRTKPTWPDYTHLV